MPLMRIPAADVSSLQHGGSAQLALNVEAPALHVQISQRWELAMAVGLAASGADVLALEDELVVREWRSEGRRRDQEVRVGRLQGQLARVVFGAFFFFKQKTAYEITR